MTTSQMPLQPSPMKALFSVRADPKQTRDLTIFHVVIPVAFGAFLGANQTGIAFYLPWLLSVVYWMLLSLIAWQVLHGMTAGVAFALRRFHFSLPLTLLAGAVLATFLLRPFMYKYSGMFSPYLLNGRTVQPYKPFEWDIEFILRHLQLWAGMIVIWVVINLVFDRFLGAPRYRATHIAPQAPLQPISNPLPQQQDNAREYTLQSSLFGFPPGTDIQALKSEDHYVRVFSSHGEKLILMRISDAIKEISNIQGARVHRSYWVAKKAIARVETQGRNLTLYLGNGLAVPVSQTYKESARLAGLISQE